MTPACYLCPAPLVTWVTERGCTLVVNEENAEAFQMTGFNEVLWDCLVQGFSYAKIIQIAAEMRAGTPAVADEMVQAVLREWRELGLVRIEGQAHG